MTFDPRCYGEALQDHFELDEEEFSNELAEAVRKLNAKDEEEVSD